MGDGVCWIWLAMRRLTCAGQVRERISDRHLKSSVIESDCEQNHEICPVFVELELALRAALGRRYAGGLPAGLEWEADLGR